MLEHVRECGFLARQKLVVDLLDISRAFLAEVAPFGKVSTLEQLLFFIVEGLLRFFVQGALLFPSFQQFAVGVVLQQVILHIGAKIFFEELSLLRDEGASTRDHILKPAVHLVLLVAARHPVELGKLIDELLHSVHGRSESLRLLVYLLGTLNDLIVQDLIRVGEVRHLAAEDSRVGNHLSGNATLEGFHTHHVLAKLLFLNFLLQLFEALHIIVLEPLDEEWIGLELVAAAQGLEEARQELLSAAHEAVALLLLLGRHRRDDLVREHLQ